MNNEISIFRFIVWKLFSLIFKEENLAVLLGRGSHVLKKKKKKKKLWATVPHKACD